MTEAEYRLRSLLDVQRRVREIWGATTETEERQRGGHPAEPAPQGRTGWTQAILGQLRRLRRPLPAPAER